MKLVPCDWFISAITCLSIHICDYYTGRALAVKRHFGKSGESKYWGTVWL